MTRRKNLNYQDYQAELKRLEQETRQNLIDLAAWAQRDALPWLWSELIAITGKRAASLKLYDAVRQGCRTSLGEREKMPKKPSFYVAQMTMFEDELLHHCKAINKMAPHPKWFAEDAKVANLHGVMTRFLHFAIILLNEASHELSNANRYGSYAKGADHHFEIFKGAEQVIYGRFSGMTNDDHAPYVGTAILRTALEVRLRRAFCVQGLTRSDTGNFRPIDLSRLFEVVRKYKTSIQFAVDFDDTMKIYRWSNFYLHGAWRDYPWVPGFLLRYLRPLLSGVVAANGSWSVNNGIKMPRETWNAIRAELDPASAPRIGFWKELFAAVKSVFTRRRAAGKWTLIPASEAEAVCEFLN